MADEPTVDPAPFPGPNESGGVPTLTADPIAEPAADEAAPEAMPEADDEGTDDESSDAADSDESGESDDSGEQPDEPRPDRRQRRAEARQAAEAARKAEVDQAVADALAAREQAAQTAAVLAARNAEDQRVMQRAAELMGSGEDENALIDAVANGDFEAADRLKLLRQRRADSAVVITAADRLAWGKVYNEIQTAREIKGTDGAVLDRVNSLPEVFRHIESAVEARVKADYEGRLERQKADYESRLGRAASGMPTTETGGRAVGAGGRAFTRDQIAQMDTATYRKNKAAIYEQEARGLIS